VAARRPFQPVSGGGPPPETKDEREERVEREPESREISRLLSFATAEERAAGEAREHVRCAGGGGVYGHVSAAAAGRQQR
jgi:hypothetical protein